MKLINSQDAIDEWRNDFKEYVNTLDIPRDDYNGIMAYIDELPSVQPERKTGKWMFGFDNRYMEKYYYCSRCGGRKYMEDKPLDHFCSNCGADMRGKQDE